jgi:hypothetical protein
MKYDRTQSEIEEMETAQDLACDDAKRDCIHARLELQLVVPESCLVRGDIGGWYRCTRCDAKFSTAIKPHLLVAVPGRAGNPRQEQAQ